MEFESLNIPKAEPRSYTDQELADILKEMMAYYQNNQGKVVGSKNVKVPQLLFALEYEKYLRETDFNRVYSLAGVNEGNSVAEFGVNLRRLIDLIQPTPPVFPIKTVQKIYYGAPGGGKSHKAKEETAGKVVYRITFHPDTDYAAFVGSYKPIVNEHGIVRDLYGKPVKDESDNKIEYKFVPQIFTNTYLEAWKSMLNDETPKPVCILIEELNRGNCAQIFGDLFQLLDRSKKGFSEYSVIPTVELAQYIKGQLTVDEFEKYYKEIRTNSDLTDAGIPVIPEWDSTNISNNKLRLCLPPNLSIVCTMNTSDQSLFPMDSAFKRRWEWKYVPIDYDCPKSQFAVKIDEGHVYDWSAFLKVVNEIIAKETHSEDKQMGNFFVKGNEDREVDCDQFVSKVMYYLWSEVCKDNPKAKKALFVYEIESEEENATDAVKKDFSFSDLFNDDNTTILNGFMRFLKIDNISEGSDSEEGVSQDDKDQYKRILSGFLEYIKADNEQNKLFRARYHFAKHGWNGLWPKVTMMGYGLKIGINKTGCYVNWYINDPNSITSELKQNIEEAFGVPQSPLEGYSTSGWSEKGGYFKLQHSAHVGEESYQWIVETVNMIYDYFESLNDHTV